MRDLQPRRHVEAWDAPRGRGNWRPRGIDATMMSEPPFQRLIGVLRRQSRPILAVAAIGTLLSVLGGLLISPRYTAKAELVVEPKAVGLVGEQSIIADPRMDEATFQTYIAGLTSRDHLRQVVSSLARDPKFASPPEEAIEPGSLSSIRKTLSTTLWHWWSTIARPVSDLLTASGIFGRSADSAAGDAVAPQLEEFERHLLVYQERGSHVIAISYTSTSPEQAALAANRVIELYIDNQYKQKRENTTGALTWIGARIPELKAELDRSESAVQEYRTSHNVAQANHTDLADQTLAGLNNQIVAAEIGLVERNARLNAVRKLQRRAAGTDSVVQTLDSPILAELRRQELGLLQSEAELAANFGKLHPKTLAAAAQLAEVRQKISREAERAVGDLETQAQIAGTQLQLLRERLVAAERVSGDVHTAEVRLQDLERATAFTSQLHESLLQRREQLREQQEMISPNVHILSLAAVPERPSSPNPLLLVVPAMIAFSIGGGLLAVAAHGLDRGLRSARDVSETLGIPCLGLVPRTSQRSSVRPHLQLLAQPYAAYTEAIRSLVAAMHLATPSNAPKAILITSSVPMEGKTTLAVSFAVYATLLGRRVVLVDLDSRRPAVLREIGTGGEPGVLNVLDADGPGAGPIQKYPGLGLDFLPVANRNDDPLAPFATGQLTALLQRLRLSYDCIIIDSPPLLAVTEARLLGSLVDKIIFVVKWGSTRREVAQNALDMLHDTGEDDADRVAAVVTQVDLKRHARYRYGDVGEYLVKYNR